MLRYHKILIHFHFQSTLLQEERPFSRQLMRTQQQLSIHAPTRGATVQDRCGRITHRTFNPRSYKRSDKREVEKRGGYSSFNPRSYKRSDNFLRENLFMQYLFQSTLLQEERRILAQNNKRNLFLSIHAPTRGATRQSIHQLHIQYFQSTLLQEERLVLTIAHLDHTPLSIHAPTRGATISNMSVLNFSYIFQSTLLQEERLVYFFGVKLIETFNPRSYKRSDWITSICNQGIIHFQSTLLQEERQIFHSL